jgi:SAM-dependent methyltransferase
MTADIRAEWDQPTAYELWYASSLRRAYGSSIERVLKPWLTETATQRVLDIGCGPGLALDRLFPTGTTVWGIDCSFQMARRASLRSQEGHLPHLVLTGSVTRLPFCDRSFDAVLCVNCLEFVSDRASAFEEIARILRSPGIAVIGVLNRRSVWEMTRRLRRPFSRHGYYRGSFFTEQELRHHIESAGLAVDEMRTAVHFPPLPPGPFVGLYERIDTPAEDCRTGAVILCKARLG